MTKVHQAEAFNEMLRVLSHDYSGHMHLIRFCIDELLEGHDENNPFVKKLTQGLDRFQDDLELLKQSTPYLLEGEVPLNKICARAFGQARIYMKKHHAEITWSVEGNLTLPSFEASVLSETLFSFAHLISTLAHGEGKNTVHISLKTEGELSELIFLKTELNKYLRQDCESILRLGDENEKTLRRSVGLDNFVAQGWSYDILNEDNNLSVRFKL